MTFLRLAPLAGMILFIAGCNASETDALSPTSPNAVTNSNAGSDAELSPTRGAPIPPRGGLTIRGIVTERLAGGGVRPMPGANINAWVDAGRMGYSYWWANGRQQTDPSGRYELTRLPAAATVIVDVWADGYVQQCAAPPIRMETDATVDVQLVSKENVTSRPDGIPMTSGFRFVSGRVLENTPEGQRPVQGTFVDYEPYMDFPAAWTVTDANGRYLICGIPADSPAVIGVNVKGVAKYATAEPGQTTGIDLVFP